MRSNPFSPLKSTKSCPSNNPKTILNCKNDHKKRGLDAALHRADRRFRVNKSRALEKLHKDKKFASLSEVEQGVMENEIIGRLEDQRDTDKLNLKKEWFRKTESGEIAEDEDDLMSCDDDDDDEEKAESDEDGEGMEMDEIQALDLGSPVDDDGNEEWKDIDDDEEVEVWSTAFIESLLEIKKESGKEWLKKIETVEKMAEAKWAE
jgi:hypothetical protein